MLGKTLMEQRKNWRGEKMCQKSSNTLSFLPSLHSPSGGNGDISQQTVQLFVVLDGKSNVTGDDTRLFVVAGGVSGQLEDFGTEVFQDGSQVHGGSGTHASGVLLQEIDAKAGEW